MPESMQETQELPERSFGWSDMWVSPEHDPRDDSTLVGERAVLTGYLRNYRLTLELKCSGLDAEQLTRRSVPPSNLSLLGLLRHLTEVERYWFRNAMAGEDVPDLYVREGESDWDIDGAVAEEAVVEEAWQNWRAEVKYGEEFVAAAADFDLTAPDGENNLRDVLVHLIEEYCRHMGHADLIRERIDGRVGQ